MFKRFVLAACVIAALTVILYAQTGVGQIQGVVVDPSGAVVPNASVTLEHVLTNNRFQITSSDAGSFVFPSLVPGEYRLIVSAVGMQRWEGRATLAAGQRAVINAALEIGRSVEQVTVAGDVTPLL